MLMLTKNVNWPVTGEMRVLLNFMHREGWSVHCLAEDAKTAISPFLIVKKTRHPDPLLRTSGASDEKIVGSGVPTLCGPVSAQF